MEYISSDTNIWVDFAVIGRLELPFRLDYTYLMELSVVERELSYPAGIKEALLGYGLEKTKLTTEEFILAEKYSSMYRKPSANDCIALAIAKSSGIVLLSGDRALRKAAEKEDVTVLGTLGILDELLDNEKITAELYEECLTEFELQNGKKVRLPKEEIQKRIMNLS